MPFQTFRHHKLPLFSISLSAFVICISTCLAATREELKSWKHSGAFYILTTPEGADLPATASESNFPLLLRLDRGNFDFSQTKTKGEDIRFTDVRGTGLPYQIEQWDAAKGSASIWVRVPTITGNTRQGIAMYWGNANAASESNGAAVFNVENGYASVMHLDESLKDEAGSLKPKDTGSTDSAGIIGRARHFAEGKGINCGEHITTFPNGDMPFTSEAWFRTETAGTAIFAWGRYATRKNGKTNDGNEVDLMIGSPPGLSWASDGPGGTRAATIPVIGKWHHVAATYADGVSQIFVDGKLDGSNQHKAAMSLMDDIYMYIGGMRGSYQFTGDIDEVRVSRVARSVNWMKLQYENQKAQQTLVGPI
ncbi:MAG: DUF2341 domain-containing protein, partial [Verrucomicrobiaceae bacterium]